MSQHVKLYLFIGVLLIVGLASAISIDNYPTNQVYNNPINFNISSSETGTGSLVNNFGNNLISWWRMDEVNSSGDPLDYMGRNNGTKYRNATQTDGYFGKSFIFNTTGTYKDYILTPSNGGLSSLDGNLNSYTISLWLKGLNSSQNTSGFRIIEKRTTGGGIYPFSWQGGALGGAGGAYQLILVVYDGTRVPYARLNDTTGGHPFDGNWHHIVMVVDASTNKIYGYKDGILRDNVTNTVLVTTANNYQITIGSGQLGAAYTFNGSIDDVMIFNRSLSTNEVLGLYNATAINYNITLANKSYTYTTYTQNRSGFLIFNTTTFTVNTPYPSVTILSPKNKTQYVDSVNFNVVSSEQGFGSIVPNLDNSLVSWWRMDDISRNNTLDYMGRNNGINYNITNVLGYFGNASYFIGTLRSYIITSSTGFGTEGSWINGTTSLWAKRVGNGSTVSQGTLYSRDASRPAMFLYYENLTYAPLGTTVYAYHYNGSIFNQLTCDFTNEQGLSWTHYAKTWFYNGTDTNQTLYINGIACNNSVFKGSTAVTSNDHWRLGAWANGAGASVSTFNGSIDDFIFFNRSLNSNEILAIYNATQINYNTLITNTTHIYSVYTQNRSGTIDDKTNYFNVVTTTCWKFSNNRLSIPPICGLINLGEILKLII